MAQGVLLRHWLTLRLVWRILPGSSNKWLNIQNMLNWVLLKPKAFKFPGMIRNTSSSLKASSNSFSSPQTTAKLHYTWWARTAARTFKQITSNTSREFTWKIWVSGLREERREVGKRAGCKVRLSSLKRMLSASPWSTLISLRKIKRNSEGGDLTIRLMLEKRQIQRIDLFQKDIDLYEEIEKRKEKWY
jgi:hypothetical protein